MLEIRGLCVASQAAIGGRGRFSEGVPGKLYDHSKV